MFLSYYMSGPFNDLQSLENALWSLHGPGRTAARPPDVSGQEVIPTPKWFGKSLTTAPSAPTFGAGQAYTQANAD